MKFPLITLASALLVNTACAQAPTPPEPPQTPDISTVTEDCGDGCSRTVTKIVNSETAEDGTVFVSENVKIVQLTTGEDGEIDIDVDVDEIEDGQGVVRKKIKVITKTDGEMTPEMQAKIDEMVAKMEDGQHAWHQHGDGVFVVDTSETGSKTRIVIHQDGEEFVSNDSNVNVEQTTNEDGSRTIRITPEDGSDSTVITITKESSSKSDN